MTAVFVFKEDKMYQNGVVYQLDM